MTASSEAGAHAPTTVTVTVLLFAAFREAIGKRSLHLEVQAGSTVSDVFDILAAREARFGRLRPYTTFALNREMVALDREVEDGDELAFLQPVSGGIR